MNIQHNPGQPWKSGYPLTLGIMAAADLLLTWSFREARWL